MLNDKRLAAAVVTAAKNGVLKYRENEERLDLIGDGWALMVWKEYARDKLRETLGVIVKMLGEIPQDCCVEIFKTKDGFAEQEMDEAVFGGELAGLFLCNHPEECRLTRVSIGTKHLLQTFSGSIAGVETAPLIIAGQAEGLAKMNETGTRVRWKERYWEFAAMAFRPECGPDDSRIGAVWNALEGVELVEWPASCRPENPDQMQIGEE